MNPLYNPFSPGAGTPPPELAGRDETLQQSLLTLARVRLGRAAKSLLLVGLRGTGKTVLLREIGRLAKKEGYQIIKLEAHEKKSFPEILLPELRQLLFTLDAGDKISTKVKRAFRVLKSFVSKIKLTVKMQEVDFGIEVDPERGTADSGNLESDLAQLFIALGEAAQDRNTAIAIIIDELQYLDEEELSSLIMVMHAVSQESLPIALFGAGLPQLVGLTGRAKSYAERLFDFIDVTPLKYEDAKSALQMPVEKEGVSFTIDALDEAVHVTQGYPYFLQEWGYQTWNLAKESPISVEVVKAATIVATQQLDKSFFRVRFDRLTVREKAYLRALAELGDLPQKSSDIANKLNMDIHYLAPLRNNLIKKGMIYSPKHGETAFTVPLFSGFLKRMMPNSNK